jgi:GNAT superfamily N-acetyltransferase
MVRSLRFRHNYDDGARPGAGTGLRNRLKSDGPSGHVGSSPTPGTVPTITVRHARPGDGAALARIHSEMATYYAALAPDHLQVPDLDGFAEEVDAALGSTDRAVRDLVAEVGGEVAGALVARLLAPEDSGKREISPDLGQTRLRIDYLAVDANHRRQGVGAQLVAAAEAWGREAGATVAETWTYQRSPLSVPFWEHGMGYEERSVKLRKALSR